MGCNDFLITIKCDDVYTHAITNWDDIQDKPDLATKDDVNNLSNDIANNYALKTEIPSLDGYAKTEDIPDINNLATKDDVNNLSNDIANNYALKTEIPSLDGYAKTEDIPDTSNLATKDEIITEFKTINGETITGTGNIEISGGSGGGSGTALNVKNGEGYSIQFISRFDYSGLQSSGSIDPQCLYVLTD